MVSDKGYGKRSLWTTTASSTAVAGRENTAGNTDKTGKLGHQGRCAMTTT